MVDFNVAGAILALHEAVRHSKQAKTPIARCPVRAQQPASGFVCDRDNDAKGAVAYGRGQTGEQCAWNAGFHGPQAPDPSSRHGLGEPGCNALPGWASGTEEARCTRV